MVSQNMLTKESDIFALGMTMLEVGLLQRFNESVERADLFSFKRSSLEKSRSERKFRTLK
jgi:hypothetical protein